MVSFAYVTPLLFCKNNQSFGDTTNQPHDHIIFQALRSVSSSSGKIQNFPAHPSCPSLDRLGKEQISAVFQKAQP
jgi:hypothetical protein